VCSAAYLGTSRQEVNPMGIGASIFLIALGAILAFAVEAQVWWLDINVVGWVLMIAGVLGLALTLTFWSRRRSADTVVERRDYSYRDDAGPPPL
jgi:heme/copper-type cytochrome/quinol oxidase subunit 2